MKSKGKQIYKTTPPRRLKYLVFIFMATGCSALFGIGVHNFFKNQYYTAILFLLGGIVAISGGTAIYLIFTKQGEPYIVYENCIYFPSIHRPSGGDKFVFFEEIVKIVRGKYDVKNYYVHTEDGHQYKIIGWHSQELLNYIGTELGTDKEND